VSLQSFRCAIYTSDGWYLSAVNGGGLPTPNAGVPPVALHTDSRTASAWETFRVVIGGDVSGIFNGMPFALQTFNGNYLTATKGGGIGGPNDASSPVHTDARTPEAWETFTFELSRF
jgi:hypothetical protein